MRSVRALVPLFAAAVISSPTAFRKDYVTLDIARPASGATHVRVTSHGLLLMAADFGFIVDPGRGQSATTTIATPARIHLSGVGRAELVGGDSAATVVARVTHLAFRQVVPTRVEGHTLEVGRESFEEAFSARGHTRVFTAARR